MNTIKNDDAAGAFVVGGPNLRPLPNKLGHNGPYLGLGGTPIERDCDRIEGHTKLFRDPERFEADLKQSVVWIWGDVVQLRVAENKIGIASEDGTLSAELIVGTLDLAANSLSSALQFMQEAYLMAEVLNDREQDRIRDARAKDFQSLISRKSRESMSTLERLAEEARLNWQISCLIDRLYAVTRTQRMEWPKEARQDFSEFVDRLDALVNPPGPEALQAMDDGELADELRKLEHQARETRRVISLIHAIKVVRNA